MKIAIFATTSWNLLNSRLGLASALKNLGHEVVLIAPKDEFTPLLLEKGFNWIDIPLNPRGKKLFSEIASVFRLIRIYSHEKFDLVNHFTPKGVIYGTIAAKLTHTHRIFNTITGLGFVFSGDAPIYLKRLVLLLYKLTLRKTKVIFQNPDNHRFFIENKFILPDSGTLILGSGIDMDQFKFTPEPHEPPPVVMLPSRFVAEKGVFTLVEAARILRVENYPVRIVLVGRSEENQPTSITEEELHTWIDQGIVEWWGWFNNMETIYPRVHIVCLPTYYMEGIPKSLIEAAASGRPIITTDVPGCRQITKHGENGLLVPPRDPEALAKAIKQLGDDPDLRAKMGKRSREIAVQNYSIDKVVNGYLSFYKENGAG